MKSKKDVHHAMKHFFNNVGVPPSVIVDFAVVQVQGEVQIICEQLGCHIQQTEERMKWDNRTE